MKEVAERIKLLRESVNLSQAKLAVLAGATQSSINRYENDQSAPPLPFLAWYADYFDVSLDYIFGRTDKPEGKLYSYKPKFSEENEQFRQFIKSRLLHIDTVPCQFARNQQFPIHFRLLFVQIFQP